MSSLSRVWWSPLKSPWQEEAVKTHWWKPAALPGTYRTRQRYMSVVSETRSLSDFCRAVKLQGEPYEYVWESIKTKQNEGTGAVRNLILLPQDSPQWGTVHILLRIGVQLLTTPANKTSGHSKPLTPQAPAVVFHCTLPSCLFFPLDLITFCLLLIH